MRVLNNIMKTDTKVLSGEKITVYTKGFRERSAPIITMVGTNCGSDQGVSTGVQFRIPAGRGEIKLWPVIGSGTGALLEFTGVEQCESLIEALEFAAQVLRIQLTANKEHQVVKTATAKTAKKQRLS